MINRAEAKIAVRDHVLSNVLEAVVGEGVGKTYLQALQEADAQVEAALRAQSQEQVGD